jgi:integrase
LNVRELYTAYIADRAPGWRESSVRSERQRLNALWPAIDGDPVKLWEALQEHGSYTRLTIWTRVSSFWDWMIEAGHTQAPNPYARWRERNKRAFANAYIRKPATQTFAETWSRLDTVEPEDIRNALKTLLWAGLRWCELRTITPDGYVTGKGGKVRKVYLPEGISGRPIAGPERYSACLRAVKRAGVPGLHKLRSIRMTEMVNRGANAFELKKYAGWSSLAVAESYVNARDERIAELVQRPKESHWDWVVKQILKLSRRRTLAAA